MRLFITFIIVFGPMTFALADFTERKIERSVANDDYQTCSFESGETGKLKFKGATREEAMERTAKACLKARIASFVINRGSSPTTERQILFAEDCVNKTFCKR